MRVLVTGSKGFIGKHLTNFLDKKKVQVISYDLIDNQDLLDANRLAKAVSKVEYIIHLAAVGDIYQATRQPLDTLRVGIEGTANLTLIANRYPIKKIIYASTWEVYGKPLYQPVDENHPCLPNHPYSIAKYGGELIIHSHINRIPWIILRLGSVYGLNMRPNAVIPLFINRALRNEVIILHGGGAQARQFTHVEDINNAFYMAIKSKIKNEIFNIVSDEIITIKELAQLINNYIPVKMISGKQRPRDVIPVTVSNKKSQRILGWKAKKRFKDGLIEIIKELNEKID